MASLMAFQRDDGIQAKLSCKLVLLIALPCHARLRIHIDTTTDLIHGEKQGCIQLCAPTSMAEVRRNRVANHLRQSSIAARHIANHEHKQKLFPHGFCRQIANKAIKPAVQGLLPVSRLPKKIVINCVAAGLWL